MAERRKQAGASEAAAKDGNGRRGGARKDRGRTLDLRDNALIVGAKLFGNKGYAATSTRELTSALGTTNGNFYHHFETKEELLFQICQKALTRIIDAATEGIEGIVDPLERLERLIRVHVEAMLADQDLHSTMLIELRSLSGTNQDAVRKRRDEYSALVREVLTAAQEAKEIRSDIPPAVMTLTLLNMLNWTIFWYRKRGKLKPSELADVIVEMFLDGARQRSRAKS